MSSLTPVPALLGGALIGLAATLLLFTHGRRAAISGLWAGLFGVGARDRGARLWFFAGMLGVGLAAGLVAPSVFGWADAPLGRAIAAGLLVGYGTQLGGGCTSGHGVCGISAFEARSVVATVTFMLTGALAVLAVRVWS